MDRYKDIKEKIMKVAGADENIKAVIAFGSSTRDIRKADRYSDLDLIIVTDAPEKWYSGEYPRVFGDMRISFIEPTLGGGRERRSIYDEDRDVDMLIFTQSQFEKALLAGEAGWVMNRGYEVLYDAIDLEKELATSIEKGHSNPTVTPDEFENMVNDFYFHNIWAGKKLLRGELWSAKMCVDGYLKNHLLKAIEWYCCEIEGKDVWHDGRFIDQWAGEPILSQLQLCFAHYERFDLLRALRATSILFEEITRKLAAKKGYAYPDTAADCARLFLSEAEIL